MNTVKTSYSSSLPIELAAMGHDLSTHASTLIAYTHTLLEYAYSNCACHNLIDDINQILKASQQLSLLINKLLSNNHCRKNELNRHDLRNPFNSIIGFCEMLLADFDKKTHPKAHVVLQQILMVWKKLKPSVMRICWRGVCPVHALIMPKLLPIWR